MSFRIPTYDLLVLPSMGRDKGCWWGVQQPVTPPSQEPRICCPDLMGEPLGHQGSGRLRKCEFNESARETIYCKLPAPEAAKQGQSMSVLLPSHWAMLMRS